MNTIFLHSTDRTLSQVLVSEFELEGIELIVERDRANLVKTINHSEVDMTLIDARDDPESLIALCAEIQRNTVIEGIRKLIILPQRDEDLIVTAFQVGADDCIFNPVRPRELVARVKTVLRRGFPKSEQGHRSRVIRHDDLEIHNDEFKAYVDGSPLDLTRSEYKILYVLASHPKRVYTRQQLLDHCGSVKDDSKGRSVDVHIRALRIKLGPSRNLVRTARGIGYYFEPSENEN